MIIDAFFRALGQSGDPRFRRVLFLGVGLTLLVLVALYAIVHFAVIWLVGDVITLPLIAVSYAQASGAIYGTVTTTIVIGAIAWTIGSSERPFSVTA